MRIPDEFCLASARKLSMPTALLTTLIVVLSPTGDADAAPPRAARGKRAPVVSAARTHDIANTTLGLRSSRMVRMAAAQAPAVGDRVVRTIDLDGERYTLDLGPSTVRAAGYEVLVQQNDGSLVAAEPQPERTVRGRVLEIPGSVVSGSMLDDGMHLSVRLPGDEKRHWIEPVPLTVAGAADGDHLVYHDDDVIRDGGCGTLADTTTSVPDALGLTGGVAGGGPYNQGDCHWFTEIAFDADHEYFQQLGSVAAVENRLNTIVEAMNEQYERDVDIHFVITTIIVREAAQDPYSSTQSANALLSQFAAHWNSLQTGVSRDVAHLFTGRDIEQGGDFNVIGVANLQDICTASAYGVVENISGLAYQTDLSAHELGHNWGADHCTCTGYTMNATLTTPSNQFSPTFTIPEISAYRDARSFCLYESCIPANDDCSDAILIDGAGVYAFTTLNATTDGSPESLCNFAGDAQIEADVWFRYVAPCDGIFTVDLCGSFYNTKVAVYENACPITGNLAIACSDESGACPSNQSQLNFTATEGTSYYIRVGGAAGESGLGTLVIDEPVQCYPKPSNDNCSSGMVLTDGTTAFTNLGASSSGPDEGGACTTETFGADVWYRYTATCNGTATLSTCNADFDTVVAVYATTCPGAPGQVLACNDDACGLQSTMTFPVTAGSIYRVRVGGVDGAVGGGDIQIECSTVSACDGDTDGNGIVDVDDLNNVILDWGTDGAANGADLTGQTPGSGPDGFVDVNDLNLIILNWGICPGEGPAASAMARG